MSDQLIRSFVRHGEKWFFVSTINRESSSMVAHGMVYAETMVWEYDNALGARGGLVFQDEGPRDSIKKHIKCCERISDTGTPDYPEESEQ